MADARMHAALKRPIFGLTPELIAKATPLNGTRTITIKGVGASDGWNEGTCEDLIRRARRVN
jgi:hypothetical protein